MGALVAAGKITKLFGDSGEVILNLYSNFPVDINKKTEPLFVRIDSLTVPLFLNRFERRGQNGAIAGFDDIDTARRAGVLLGLELLVRESEESKSEDAYSGEVCMEDFIGFTVKFKGNNITGIVEDFIDSENNPLFVIGIDGKEALVPASNDFIVKYSIRKKELTLRLPEGLLELYL